jgi:hypothetical protein
MNDHPTCETCRFFEHGTSGGWCMRYAPRPTTVVRPMDADDGCVEVLVHWPQTSRTDWCGEHEPAPEQPREVNP